MSCKEGKVMNIILKKFFEYAAKDLYSFADYDLPEFRKALESYKTKHRMTSAPPKKIRRQMKVTRIQMHEGIVYRAIHKTHRSNKKVLFIHGGGLILEALPLHWDLCLRLAERTGCEIIFPQYPLVPESDTVTCHEMLYKLYKKLLETTPPEDLTIIGDSAGGTLALSLSMLARDRGLPVANEIVLISPGFVLDCNDEELERLERIRKHDFIIGKFPVAKVQALWKGDLDLSDYRADVTKGDIHGLPRITIFTGTYDIMNIPARRFASKLREQGHPHSYNEKIDGLHDYALMKSAKNEFELMVSRIVE